MIVVYCLCIVVFVALNLSNKKSFFKYCLFYKNGFNSLKQIAGNYGYRYNIKYHMLIIVSIVLVIGICCWQFEVRLESAILLVFVASLLLPQVFIWLLFNSYQEKNFNQFTMFLQTFIAVFKLNPKTYPTLIECRKVCSGETLELIDEIESNLTAKGSIEECFECLLKQCPHFIVHNLISIITTVESHGGTHYLDGLDLIQDDIDDWIEDTYSFKKCQMLAKNRMMMLCGLSSIIAIVAKNMLQEMEFDTTSLLYQIAILVFLFILIITLFMAHQALSHCWFEKEEMIC